MAKISLNLLNKPSFYSSLSETRQKTWFWQFQAFGQPARAQMAQMAELTSRVDSYKCKGTPKTLKLGGYI